MMAAQRQPITNGVMSETYSKPEDGLTLRLSTNQIIALLGALATLIAAIVGTGWLAIPSTIDRVEKGVSVLQVSVAQLGDSTKGLSEAVRGLQETMERMQEARTPAPAQPRPVIRQRPQPKPQLGILGF